MTGDSGAVNQSLIHDPGDPRVGVYRGLTDEALRRRREAPGGDLAGIFVCEGTMVTERALAAGHMPESVLVADNMIPRLPRLPPELPVYVGSPDLVEAIIGFRFHRGFVAAFRRPPLADPFEVMDKASRVLVCENVTNPTNLGTIVRSAAALGIDAMFLDPTSCDPYYRRVTRVSMGAVFAFPHARLARFPDGLDILADGGFRLVGLTPDPGSVAIGNLAVEGRMALVLGAEGPGLSPATIGALDDLVHIPMRPGVDSLNVAAAAAIGAYVIGAGGRGH